jgi:SAM-dependent methyltransferase
MNPSSKEEIRKAVRLEYARIATDGGGCGPSCCDASTETVSSFSEKLGYSPGELSSIPSGSDMGLGCGNPKAIAALRKGETVLDLGSGGGFDCFLAAQEVGENGRVIGVDMTPEMLHKARANADKAGLNHVEFRLGEIEHLPLADQSVDVIISNCVINLSPDKPGVFAEAFRVLKPGGRLAISDVITSAPLPESVRDDMSMYTGCMAGASTLPEMHQLLENAGFIHIEIQPKDESRSFIREWAPGRNIEDYVVSATIEAVKPSAK